MIVGDLKVKPFKFLCFNCGKTLLEKLDLSNAVVSNDRFLGLITEE